MQFILNTLHLANGGTADDEGDCACVVHQTFCGKLSSTVTCDNCRNVTTASDPYMDLSLDVRITHKKRKLNGASKKDSPEETPLDVQSCLERFTVKEKLGSAEYTCRNCDSPQNATKQLSIKRLPPVLCIHLKVRH
jgi:ubiquitin carboxyl-terminal hydrolase 22/27/51